MIINFQRVLYLLAASVQLLNYSYHDEMANEWLDSNNYLSFYSSFPVCYL